MIANQRIIWSDDATLKDLSIALNDAYAETYVLPLVAAEDYLYIGSDLPFNHRYFNVSVVNDVASVASVEIWNGTSWVSAVDVIDQTSVAGKTLARSGIISWTLDRNGFWGQESTTEDVTGLTSLKIYDFYWVRLSFSADLKATTALRYVGHKFADDDDLRAQYPDLLSSSLLDAFETGKTTWVDQHIVAAEEIIRYIRKKKIAWNRNQILNWDQFNMAAVHKVAEIIMTAFGEDYSEQRKLAESKYKEAIDLSIYEVDRSEDGRRDELEKRAYGMTLVRR